MSHDPWATIAAAKWDQAKAALHDIEAHKHWTAGAWPRCRRCNAIAIEFHDAHGIAHLVPTEARQRHEQENQL